MPKEALATIPETARINDSEDLFKVSDVIKRYKQLYAECRELAKKQLEQTLTPPEIFEKAQLSFDSFVQIIKDRLAFIERSRKENPNSWVDGMNGYSYKHNGRQRNPIVVEKANCYDETFDIETLFFHNDGRDGSISFTAEILDPGNLRFEFESVQKTSNPNVSLIINLKVGRCNVKWRHDNSVSVVGTRKFCPSRAEVSGIIDPFLLDSFRVYIKLDEDTLSSALTP